jgi:hypothetical protein
MQKVGNREINESFKPQHITSSSLTATRMREEAKYAGAIKRLIR